jgi:hypothetical protein
VHQCRKCRTASVEPRANPTGIDAARSYRSGSPRRGQGGARRTPALPVGVFHHRYVQDRLRLFPDYCAESPIWSRYGLVPFSHLAISPELRADLTAWKDEALDPSHPLATRSEKEWKAAGRLLAARLAEETGLKVDLDL